jgi:integrase
MLEELGRKHAKSTLYTIKRVCVSIFDRAIVAHDLIDVNPWSQIKLKPIKAQPSPHLVGKRQPLYTIEETMAILKALGGDTQAKLVFALSAIAALRPEETAALQWPDIVDDHWLFIQRTTVRGDIQSTKTDAATDRIPLIEPVRGLLVQWFVECKAQPWWEANLAGWMFPNSKMEPLHRIDDFARKRIGDVIEAQGLEWKSLYAGRRGAITTIIDLDSGNYHSGQELAVENGMRLFEQKLLEAGKEQA